MNNTNKNTVHIISHTHWDREWYLNSKYTNAWLVPFFNNLFSMLEKEPKYIFVLDGQIAMIEDYFEELDKEKYNVNVYKRQIRKYIKQNRLFIGPYFLQPDWQLLSEESLVRNMLIGIQSAKALGGSMGVGWLLDNFGQISQTTQLHKEFGLRGLYVWRGVEMNPKDIQSEFLWESPDGTKLPSVYLLDSYRNVMRLAEYSDIMKERIYNEVKKLRPFATTGNILLMNGYDQEMNPDDIQPYIKDGQMDSDTFRIIQSNPEKFIDDVMAERPELKAIQGALYSGRFISVFPGVMSTRMYLKLQNDEQQKALEKRVEPLSTLIWALGGEYEKTQIREAWKTLLKNHPHDNICGVGIDAVHTDMEARSRIVNQLTLSLTEQKLKELSSLIDTSKCDNEEVKVVFNPSFFARSEHVKFENGSFFVKDIPSLGYKVVEKSDEISNPLIIDKNTVSNRQIKVSFNENGSFDLLYKKTGKLYKELGLMEDRADTGDEYNYSYPDVDKIMTTRDCKAKISFHNQSKGQLVVKVELEMELPESDANNHTKRSETVRKLPIVTYYTINADSVVVKCRTVLRNTVKDHLMRVLFETNINTEFAYAGTAFDVLKRPIHVEDYDETTIPEAVKKIIVGAREAKPNTIFLNREFVDLNDDNEGLAVLSKGLPQYQIINDSTIALTLFRSVGWIAKEINSRIGDAGPEIFTPDAQCLREMEFEYAVYPHTGDVETGLVCRTSDVYNTSLVKFTTDRHVGVLDTEKSYFSASDSNSSLKITALKRSEDGKSIIVRGYNSSTKSTEVKINCSFEITKACLTNLLEEKKEILKFTGNSVQFSLGAKKIVTVRIDIKREDYPLNDNCEVILEREHIKENFDEYDYAQAVTPAEILNEKERAEALKAKMNHPMWRRTALEAQLSAILTQHHYDEKRIEELGYELNEARIQRRIYDYINHFKVPDPK